MAILRIDLRVSETRPHVRQRVTLDGVTIELVLSWNGREGRWYCTVLDSVGEIVVGGRKLVADWQVFRRVQDDRMPPGRFAVIDRAATGLDPDLDAFAEDRYFLGYLPAADVAAAGA